LCLRIRKRPENHKRSEQRNDENRRKFEEYYLKGKRKKPTVLCGKKDDRHVQYDDPSPRDKKRRLLRTTNIYREQI
jgi:hypothetical protein